MPRLFCSWIVKEVGASIASAARGLFCCFRVDLGGTRCVFLHGPQGQSFGSGVLLLEARQPFQRPFTLCQQLSSLRVWDRLSTCRRFNPSNCHHACNEVVPFFFRGGPMGLVVALAVRMSAGVRAVQYLLRFTLRPFELSRRPSSGDFSQP